MKEIKNSDSNILRSKEFDEVLSKNPPRSYKIVLYSIILLSVLLILSLFIVRYPDHIKAKVRVESIDSSLHYRIIISDEQIHYFSENQKIEIILGDTYSPIKKHDIFKICDNRQHWIFQEDYWIIPICGDVPNKVMPLLDSEEKTCVITCSIPLFFVIF